MSDYAAERYNPDKFAMCGILTLQFDGDHLTMMGGKKGTYKYKAVSGKPVNGKFDYSAERQKVKDVGPIPDGKYWIRPDELDDNLINCLSTKFCDSWGRFRITIHPYTDTETGPRGGFFIHGGAVPGSAGCIDLTKNMSNFVDDLRHEVIKSGYLFKKCFIPLLVKYRTDGK